MTPEDQRIAIAQALGIKQIIMFQGEPWYSLRGDGKPNRPVPDYLNDLNSCHEMEKALTNQQLQKYGDCLQELVCYWVVGVIVDYPRDLASLAKIAHATAAQRCEAFLKTLGLWKEENP